jgi:hypothetical protein
MLLGTSSRTYGTKTRDVSRFGSRGDDEAPTDRKNSIILDAGHIQILNHALNFSITDVCPINMADQVQNG